MAVVAHRRRSLCSCAARRSERESLSTNPYRDRPAFRTAARRLARAIGSWMIGVSFCPGSRTPLSRVQHMVQHSSSVDRLRRARGRPSTFASSSINQRSSWRGLEDLGIYRVLEIRVLQLEKHWKGNPIPFESCTVQCAVRR